MNIYKCIAYICTCMFTYKGTYTYMHICIYVCIYAHVYIGHNVKGAMQYFFADAFHTDICIYIYIYIPPNIYMYT